MDCIVVSFTMQQRPSSRLPTLSHCRQTGTWVPVRKGGGGGTSASWCHVALHYTTTATTTADCISSQRSCRTMRVLCSISGTSAQKVELHSTCFTLLYFITFFVPLFLFEHVGLHEQDGCDNGAVSCLCKQAKEDFTSCPPTGGVRVYLLLCP